MTTDRRCRTCKHWKPHMVDAVVADCTALDIWDHWTICKSGRPSHGYEQGTAITTEDFGCVHWEKKEGEK